MKKNIIIANPIYDIIFKYLMEDEEIAKGLLSTILEEEIISLELRPQEVVSNLASAKVDIMRFDFKAEIQLSDGSKKKILIELQKAKQSFDITRFRRYLGYNYSETNEETNVNLPIITIYFLGFKLEHSEAPIIKVKRQAWDVINEVQLLKKEPFIELLTHDSVIIQIPYLNRNIKTKIEERLQIFVQDFKTSKQHEIVFKGDTSDPIVKKMVMKLKQAISEKELRLKMEYEDEVERIILREKAELQKALDIKELELAAANEEAKKERKKAEVERKKAEAKEAELQAERQKAEAEALKNAELLRELEELKKKFK